MPLHLTIEQGKGRARKYRFRAERVSIGRGAENDVVVNHSGVSRVHARIEQREGGWVLHDEGSANGTRLNGALLAMPVPLQPGDRFTVGPVRFTFSPRADASAAASARAAALGWTRLPRYAKL